MMVLFVVSGNGKVSAFIPDQEEALKRQGVVIDYFLVKGKGVGGYLKNLNALKKKIRAFRADVIHAHYGLSGLLSSLQRTIPVVVTFHGSDINQKKVRFFSKMCSAIASKSIFVSPDLAKKLNETDPIIIPCGVDLSVFDVFDRSAMREHFKMKNKKYILFSSHFTNAVKNYTLAEQAIKLLEDNDVELIELKGYNRDEVAKLMNAVDACLLTSISEGSPQFVKEAMSCNCPVVSTDVGDVRELFGELPGYYLVESTPHDVAKGLKDAITFGRTKGRERMRDYSNELVAERVIAVYKSALRS